MLAPVTALPELAYGGKRRIWKEHVIDRTRSS
jgi:hypothetical protein